MSIVKGLIALFVAVAFIGFGLAVAANYGVDIAFPWSHAR